ncbi:MAG: endo-1,4-beta-xylanase [Prolixibacteraceae bacterium]
MGKTTFFTVLLFIFSLGAKGQQTPPSCVILAPHTNAYFQEGTNIQINVFSNDVGGTSAGGTVTKVEYFNEEQKLGETTKSEGNLFSFVWENVSSGSYRIVAKASDNENSVSVSAGVFITVDKAPVKPIGLSANKGKYLGNVINSGAPADYNTYWNGVTAENACKWGSVEANRDVMNWKQADVAYNHAKYNNLVFRYHTLAWGSQYPDWIKTLSPTEFQAEMEEYMAAIAERYPMIDQIDVLNENLYKNTWNGQEHAAGTPYFRTGLGGTGTTGYDWVIWLFEKARFYFPNSKLIMNDFELENNLKGINEMLDVIKVLRDRGLIDGIGTQAHYFNVDGVSPANLLNSLNEMAKSGLPIYVTELDLKGAGTTSEAAQKSSYSNLFPVYWKHPAVAGITLWGYVDGATWSSGTGILNSNGTPRTAMTWLTTFMEGLPDVGYPFAGSSETNQTASNLLVNGEFDQETYSWSIDAYNGAVGEMSVVTGADLSGENALMICPTTTGVADWEVQVAQAAPFEAGKDYEISFLAQADAPRSLTLCMQMAGSPYTIYLEEKLDLTTAIQAYTFSFTPSVTDATNKIKFFVGTDDNCLTVDKVVFKKAGATGIPKTIQQVDIAVYPNPVVAGKFTIRHAYIDVESIEIITLQGKVVKRIPSKDSSTEIEVADLQKGSYFIRLITTSSCISKKIIVL